MKSLLSVLFALVLILVLSATADARCRRGRCGRGHQGTNQVPAGTVPAKEGSPVKVEAKETVARIFDGCRRQRHRCHSCC